jgi:MFS family permease
MSEIKIKPPYVLLIIAALLAVFGLLYDQFILVTIPVELQIDNVILTAITFICIFVAILLVYIFLINLAGQLLTNRISEKIHRIINMALIVGIVGSIIMLFQPFSMFLYRRGFPVLLFSLLGFILWSHIIPQELPEEEANSI